MSSAASHSHLRLVGRFESSEHEASLAVVKENRIAAHASGMSPAIVSEIDHSDPRWILAMQTQARLQGTVLTPDRRDQLLKNATKLGLRPFEANLVIAIVQDRARCGLPVDESRPALSLVGCEKDSDAQPRQWPTWLMMLAAAAALTALMIRWLTP